jgi:hypothetical protein
MGECKMSTGHLIYLGWQDRGNFGDDLLYDTWRAALPGIGMEKAPIYRTEIVRSLGSIARRRLRGQAGRRTVLLGGGTTIGFATWFAHVRVTQLLYGSRRVFIAGAGCAEACDAYATALQPQDWRSWSRLRGVDLRGVRGPLSAREVERSWRSTEVVGDPALLYPVVVDVPRELQPQGVLGVCLGSHDSTRYDIDIVANAVERIAHEHGFIPVVFQLSESDEAVSQSLAQRLGNAAVETFDGDVHAMMTAVASCSLFVSERLHGAVASVSLAVPTVALSYASKSDDFWMSVTGERAVVRPTSDADELVVQMRAAMRPEMRQGIAAAVEILQARLMACVQDLLHGLGEDPVRPSTSFSAL